MRHVIADLTTAVALASKKKSVFEKAQTSVQAFHRRGGKLGLITNEISSQIIQRQKNERERRQDKGWLTQSNDGLEKIRQVIINPDTQFVDSNEHCATDDNIPSQLTVTTILYMLEELRDLKK